MVLPVAKPAVELEAQAEGNNSLAKGSPPNMEALHISEADPKVPQTAALGAADDQPPTPTPNTPQGSRRSLELRKDGEPMVRWSSAASSGKSTLGSARSSVELEAWLGSPARGRSKSNVYDESRFSTPSRGSSFRSSRAASPLASPRTLPDLAEVAPQVATLPRSTRKSLDEGRPAAFAADFAPGSSHFHYLEEKRSHLSMATVGAEDRSAPLSRSSSVISGILPSSPLSRTTSCAAAASEF